VDVRRLVALDAAIVQGLVLQRRVAGNSASGRA
jgi:hypothetical protein